MKNLLSRWHRPDRRRMVDQSMESNSKKEKKLPPKLVWLADAPLFIDADQVSRFYDAVVRPNTVQDEVKLTLTQQTVKELEGKLGLEASLTPGELALALSKVFAFIKPEFKASGEAALTRSHTDEHTVEVTLKEISTPQRQLEQLVFHYIVNHPERIFVTGTAATASWNTPAIISAVPRCVVFLDLPGQWEADKNGWPRTKLIPTAAEFENGKVELLYAKFRGRKGEEPPAYPESAPTEEELIGLRQEYWKWFDEHFSATRAMITIEEASSTHGRIRWIDYRVPLNDRGDTLHLHACPAGQYDAGVLAYNFVKRGYTHGLRLVGTVKSGPDLNILAIYDK